MRRFATWFLPFFLVSSLFYWITSSIAVLKTDDYRNLWYQRHYEYLTEGFAKGHTYLSLPPAAKLLKLPDPFDPNANYPYRLWDATLYQGKYYLYYGPTPSIVFMLPIKVLTQWTMPQWLSEAVFAILGLLGLSLLLGEIAETFFDKLPLKLVSFIIFTCLNVTWLPVTLRWESVWGMPVVAACACLWWTLYFLWRFHQTQGSDLNWAVLSGFGLGLLLGSRVTYLFATAGFLLFYAHPHATRKWLKFRGIVVVASLVFAAGIGLLLYNYARFGSFTEFGQSRQLWGDNERHVKHFNPALLPFNVWLYLFSIPLLSPFFPFAHGVFPTELPQGYMEVQEVQGLLFSMPIHVLGIFALFWVIRKHNALRPLLLASSWITLCGGLVLFCWAGSTTRYMTELLSGWIPLTAVGLFIVFNQYQKRFRKLTVFILCLWSIGYTWAASAAYMGLFHRTNPITYNAIAHALDYPSQYYAQWQKKTFGPLELNISLVPFTTSSQSILVRSGRPGRAHSLILQRLNSTHVRLLIVENDQITLYTPILEIEPTAFHIQLDAPWLYPPAEHPYWDNISTANKTHMLTHERIMFQSSVTETTISHSYDAIAFMPTLTTREQDPNAPAWVVP